MKKVLLFVALSLALFGCANQVVQTPAQVAAKVCPSLTTTITALQGLVGMNEEEITFLADAQKIIKPVCEMDLAKVQFSDLKTMVNDAVPKLDYVIKLSPLTDEQKNQSLLVIAAAQIVIANLP